MPVFAYRALTREGARAHGVVDASSAHGAWNALRERGLFPTRLDPAAAGAGARAEHRAIVIRQVAALVRGGVALTDALAIVAETAPGPLAAALARIAEAVRDGVSFARACERDGVLVGASHCAVIAAGEASGALAATLRDVAADLDRSATRRREMRRLLTYPAILLLVACGVVTGIGTVVLPELTALVAARPETLPLPTRAMLGARAILADAWWALLALAAIGVGSAWRWSGGPAGRARVHRTILRLPIVGSIARDASIARFAEAAARTLRAGLPLDVALAHAIAAVPNDVLRDEVTAARRAILAGEPLRAALANTRMASSAVLGLVGTGEETGGLADAFAEIGALHADRADERIRSVFALLEPALIIGLALLVLALVWAVLVPFLTYDPTGAA